MFGSTSFVLSDQATFVIEEHGSYVRGGTMLPFDTDFDFGSTSRLASFLNGNFLKDALDPYGIGRTVELEFSEEGKRLWEIAHAEDVATSLDDPGPLADFLPGVLYYDNIDPARAALAASDLLETVWKVGRYVENGHNVVYGTNGGDIMDASTPRGYGIDPSLPNIYVAGEGADLVTTAAVDGEIVHGGAHGDTIIVTGALATVYGGYGNDAIHAMGGGSTLRGGEGADTFAFSSTQGPDRDFDSIADAEAGDRISLDGGMLTGGRERLGPGRENTYYQAPWAEDHILRYAEESAIYDISDGSLMIDLEGGHRVFVDDYSFGDAGIGAEAARTVHTDDIRPFVSDFHGASYQGVEITDMSGSAYYAYVYNGLRAYTVETEEVSI